MIELAVDEIERVACGELEQLAERLAEVEGLEDRVCVALGWVKRAG